MINLQVLNHPLVEHHLAELREATTPPARFREIVAALSYLLVCEATSDLPTQITPVQTPLARIEGRRLSGRIAIVPILRAGLGMVAPCLAMLGEAEVWHLGVFRDERTLEPVQYYHKLPPGNPPDVAMIVDPMLATGGSAVWALAALTKWGVKRVKVLSIIGAPEGVQRVQSAYPEAEIHLCALDDNLNERGFIVPGLGDAGDRIFNTL